MKISIVDGEKVGIKYITAGTERVVVVEDFSSNYQIEDENEKVEKPYHSIEWKTNIGLKELLDNMKELESNACHDFDKAQGRINKSLEPRGMAVGRKSGESYRLHPRPEFWQDANPRSQLQEEDISLSLLTPHYRLHCHNLSYRESDRELPLYVDERTLGNLERKPVKGGVNRVEVIVYFNISETLADLITKTSPFFTPFKEDETTKAILIHQFDQLLAQCQKPLRLN